MKPVKEVGEGQIQSIPFRDRERSISNDVSELWELIGNYASANPNFALQMAKRILADPKVFIKTAIGEHKLTPWNRYEYATKMLEISNEKIAELGLNWIESRMLGKPAYAITNKWIETEIPPEAKKPEKRIWHIWDSSEERKLIKELKELLTKGKGSEKEWVEESERLLRRRAFNSDQIKAVIKQLKRIPTEHKNQTIDLILELCSFSEDAREEISEICKERGDEVFESLKSIRDRTKSLIHEGVSPENAFSLVRLHEDRLKDVTKNIETLKKMGVDGDIIDFYVSKHSKADLAHFAERMDCLKKLGVDSRVAASAALMDEGPEKVRKILEYTNRGLIWDALSTVNCIRGSKGENMEFWLDRVFDLGKLRVELSYAAIESVARTISTDEELAAFSQTFYSFFSDKTSEYLKDKSRHILESKAGDHLVELFCDRTLTLQERLKLVESHISKTVELGYRKAL